MSKTAKNAKKNATAAAADNADGMMMMMMMPEVKQEAYIKPEVDYSDDDSANNKKNTKKKGTGIKQGNNKAKAAAPTAAAKKKKEEDDAAARAKKNLSSEIAHGLKNALIMRCGDKEMENENGPLRVFIKRHVGSKYKRVPRATLREVAKKRRMYALTFGWVNGERAYLQISPVRMLKLFNDHPKKAPAGEPRSVAADIKTTDKNNGLVLVKHADDNGDSTAVHFTGLTKATALVSPDLLFYGEKKKKNKKNKK
jgi:hypothetical protein